MSIDVYRISYSMNYVYRAEKSNKSHWFVLHRRAELMCDEHHPLSIKRRHSQCPKVNRHDTRNDRERLVIVESIHHLTGDERDDCFLHATCIIWRSSFPIVLLLYTRERERTKKKKKKRIEEITFVLGWPNDTTLSTTFLISFSFVVWFIYCVTEVLPTNWPHRFSIERR